MNPNLPPLNLFEPGLYQYIPPSYPQHSQQYPESRDRLEIVIDVHRNGKPISNAYWMFRNSGTTTRTPITITSSLSVAHYCSRCLECYNTPFLSDQPSFCICGGHLSRSVVVKPYSFTCNGDCYLGHLHTIKVANKTHVELTDRESHCPNSYFFNQTLKKNRINQQRDHFHLGFDLDLSGHTFSYRYQIETLYAQHSLSSSLNSSGSIVNRGSNRCLASCFGQSPLFLFMSQQIVDGKQPTVTVRIRAQTDYGDDQKSINKLFEGMIGPAFLCTTRNISRNEVPGMFFGLSQLQPTQEGRSSTNASLSLSSPSSLASSSPSFFIKNEINYSPDERRLHESMFIRTPDTVAISQENVEDDDIVQSDNGDRERSKAPSSSLLNTKQMDWDEQQQQPMGTNEEEVKPRTPLSPTLRNSAEYPSSQSWTDVQEHLSSFPYRSSATSSPSTFAGSPVQEACAFDICSSAGSIGNQFFDNRGESELSPFPDAGTSKPAGQPKNSGGVFKSSIPLPDDKDFALLFNRLMNGQPVADLSVILSYFAENQDLEDDESQNPIFVICSSEEDASDSVVQPELQMVETHIEKGADQLTLSTSSASLNDPVTVEPLVSDADSTIEYSEKKSEQEDIMVSNLLMSPLRQKLDAPNLFYVNGAWFNFVNYYKIRESNKKWQDPPFSVTLLDEPNNVVDVSSIAVPILGPPSMSFEINLLKNLRNDRLSAFVFPSVSFKAVPISYCSLIKDKKSSITVEYQEVMDWAQRNFPDSTLPQDLSVPGSSFNFIPQIWSLALYCNDGTNGVFADVPIKFALYP